MYIVVVWVIHGALLIVLGKCINRENYKMFGRVIIFITEQGALIFLTVLRPGLSSVDS